MNRLICTLACLLVSCRFACGQSPSGPIDQEWRSYGHDPGGMRFSPLKQIDRSNVEQLRKGGPWGDTGWQVPGVGLYLQGNSGEEIVHNVYTHHHVKDGAKYPAVLLTTGINDPRVDAWEAGKMAARLQAASKSGKPVLLRIDYDAGHGFGSTKKSQYEERADMYAFLLWQFGVKGFQP